MTQKYKANGCPVFIIIQNKVSQFVLREAVFLRSSLIYFGILLQ